MPRRGRPVQLAPAPLPAPGNEASDEDYTSDEEANGGNDREEEDEDLSSEEDSLTDDDGEPSIATSTSALSTSTSIAAPDANITGDSPFLKRLYMPLLRLAPKALAQGLDPTARYTVHRPVPARANALVGTVLCELQDYTNILTMLGADGEKCTTTPSALLQRLMPPPPVLPKTMTIPACHSFQNQCLWPVPVALLPKRAPYLMALELEDDVAVNEGADAEQQEAIAEAQLLHTTPLQAELHALLERELLAQRAPHHLMPGAAARRDMVQQCQRVLEEVQDMSCSIMDYTLRHTLRPSYRLPYVSAVSLFASASIVGIPDLLVEACQSRLAHLQAATSRLAKRKAADVDAGDASAKEAGPRVVKCKADAVVASVDSDVSEC
jgi:hypothetical protein